MRKNSVRQTFVGNDPMMVSRTRNEQLHTGLSNLKMSKFILVFHLLKTSADDVVLLSNSRNYYEVLKKLSELV